MQVPCWVSSQAPWSACLQSVGECLWASLVQPGPAWPGPLASRLAGHAGCHGDCCWLPAACESLEASFCPTWLNRWNRWAKVLAGAAAQIDCRLAAVVPRATPSCTDALLLPLPLLSACRIIAAVARQHLLPPFLATVHKRFGTPWVATLLQGVATALIALFTGRQELAACLTAKSDLRHKLYALPSVGRR